MLAVLSDTVTVAAKVAFAGVMFAVPSKDVPPIVLAVYKAVAVAAFPVVSWFSVPTTKSIVPSPSS